MIPVPWWWFMQMGGKPEIDGGAELSWKVNRFMERAVEEVRENETIEKLNRVVEIHGEKK